MWPYFGNEKLAGPGWKGPGSWDKCSLKLTSYYHFFFCAVVFNLIEGEHPHKQHYKQTHTQIQTGAQCLFFFVYIFFFLRGYDEAQKDCSGWKRKNKPAPVG